MFCVSNTTKITFKMAFDTPYITGIIDKIQFGILSNEMVEKMSVVDIKDSKMAGPNTVYAPEMGSIDNKPCVICGNKMNIYSEGNNDCTGHFGHIKLNYPVPNPLFKSEIAAYASCFCNRPLCARLIFKKEHLSIEGIMKKEGQARIEAIKAKVDEVEECPHCKNPHGKIKYIQKDNKFVMSYNKKDDVIPVNYLLLHDIFNNIRDEDLFLFGFKKDKILNSRPANMIIKNLIVLPTICRLPVKSGDVECHDDITYKYIDIIKVNNKLADMKNLNEKKINEYIDNLDYHITMIMDNTKNKITDKKKRMFKCIHSRIKGKNGLIRKHMCGKRVNFCARTVIGPEANCMVDEIIVPKDVACKLTFPVRVTEFNINECHKWLEQDKVAYVMKEENGVKEFFDTRYSGFERQGTKLDMADIIKKKDGTTLTYEVLFYAKGKVNLEEGDMVLKDGKFMPIIFPKKKKVKLELGYIVERHLMDGDWVLLNRQPSLRAESLRAKKVKILPCKTFRFNLASTEAFNADFDGDEMNIWVSQSYEALSELVEICSVEANFTTSQHSRPIIAMKQDSMTGGYLLTYGEIKIDKATFFDCLMALDDMDIMTKYDHIREVYRWKGVEAEVVESINKEIFEMEKKKEILKEKKINLEIKLKSKNKDMKLLKETITKIKDAKIKIDDLEEKINEMSQNFEGILEERLMFSGRSLFSFLLPDDFEYTFQNNMDPNNKPVFITRGVMISGTLNKAVMGSSSGSISHMLRINYSSRRACDFVSYYQMVIARWLLTRGFSVGIEDCIPQKIEFAKAEASKCFSQALLHMQTEEDEELRELKINNSLNNARDVGQRIAKESLSPYNSFVCMIRSGAKGNDNNITQITSMLGQQNAEGKRMNMVFNKRTLPHFIPDFEDYVANRNSNSKILEKMFSSRGFVHSGFYKGLEPHEFFFHASGGREGLIDTACKTAETGYVQRKMVKMLEDLTVAHDGSVRDAYNHVISFDYGGDNFDGSKIIYRDSQPLFMDVESVCNKLNADYEWAQNKK